jgi:hypothetical protein
LTFGTTGVTAGTLLVDSGVLTTITNPIDGTNGNVTKTGSGTVTTSGGATYNSLNVLGGRYVQTAGFTTINTVSSGLQVVGAGAGYELNGGTLRSDAITISSGGTFNWGSGILTSKTIQGSSGVTDYNLAGYQSVRAGTTIAFDGSLDTNSGSVLALHGSPSFYSNFGIRFTNIRISGNLDLLSANDRLAVEISPYLLRPFSPSQGSGAIGFGSVPLVAVLGDITGTFDTFGTVYSEGAGFSEFTGAFSGVGSLTANTWKLEYQNDVVNPAGFAAGTYDLVVFHYRVTGYVPEPETFGLMMVGTLTLRYWRRRPQGAVEIVSPVAPRQRRRRLSLAGRY